MNSDALHQLLDRLGLVVAERRDVPGREAVTSDVPQCLHGSVRGYLERKFGNRLYYHQARAIEEGVQGRSLCLATGMASGKSHIFIAVAAHMLLEDPHACVLALYPAKALIQDQKAKWEEVLSSLELKMGYIDGDVPMDQRRHRLQTCRLILATPDVAHAWLLPNAKEPPVRGFLENLRLLILDEAHVYEGVFGSNMAYFVRRLRAVSGLGQCICSTATLAQPREFISTLTGLDCTLIDSEQDGSFQSPKTVMLVKAGRDGKPLSGLQMMVDLLVEVSRTRTTPFLAFADSRRMVERIVTLVEREDKVAAGSDTPSDDAELADSQLDLKGVLPYRAGYEAEDRRLIQEALSKGELRGVVSTSALELGLDIGDIDLVIMLNPPATVKAFRQRLGRAGRVNAGTCLVLDVEGELRAGGLSRYMDGRPEPNRLYLENRYLQYVNVLCAAAELPGLPPGRIPEAFSDLPNDFKRWLQNELDPHEPVPSDLYQLKQMAQDRPHLQFPLRTGLDRELQVFAGERSLGTVTLSQALREAYPGAVYYYMGKPYRVVRYLLIRDRIEVRKERNYTTDPILQSMAFPRWPEGAMALSMGSRGQFVLETEIQVSERCSGFVEKRGPNREQHLYGDTSSYSQKVLYRYVQTSGVLWWFPDVKLEESAARLILSTFCREAGIHEGDVELGQYFMRQHPVQDARDIRGWCIYDVTWGGLRLTSGLVDRFAGIVGTVLASNAPEGDEGVLSRLQELAKELSPVQVPTVSGPSGPVDDDKEWATVIARGERAILRRLDVSEEVTVKDFRYTPRGIVYGLEHPDPEMKHTAPYDSVVPIPGVTKRVLWNLMTGEEKPLD